MHKSSSPQSTNNPPSLPNFSTLYNLLPPIFSSFPTSLLSSFFHLPSLFYHFYFSIFFTTRFLHFTSSLHPPPPSIHLLLPSTSFLHPPPHSLTSTTPSPQERHAALEQMGISVETSGIKVLLCQCTTDVSISYSCVSVLLMCQCTTHVSVYYSCVSILLMCQCTTHVSMYLVSSLIACCLQVRQGKHYLVNLNADPCLNELLVYYLKVNSFLTYFFI